MFANQYQACAALTESPVGAETLRRLAASSGTIVGMVKRIRTALAPADQTKRFVYYGEPGSSNDALLNDAGPEARYMHGILGILSELDEILEMHQQDQVFDRTHLIEELGDLLWYIALIASSHDISLSHVMERNIAKLAARNRGKGKFDLAGTLERNIPNERAILNDDLIAAQSDSQFSDLPVE